MACAEAGACGPGGSGTPPLGISRNSDLWGVIWWFALQVVVKWELCARACTEGAQRAGCDLTTATGRRLAVVPREREDRRKRAWRKVKQMACVYVAGSQLSDEAYSIWAGAGRGLVCVLPPPPPPGQARACRCYCYCVIVCSVCSVGRRA